MPEAAIQTHQMSSLANEVKVEIPVFETESRNLVGCSIGAELGNRAVCQLRQGPGLKHMVPLPTGSRDGKPDVSSVANKSDVSSESWGQRQASPPKQTVSEYISGKL